MKIYTKAGDRGLTKLGSGVTVPKSHELVEAYGTVDELTSFLGLAVSEISGADVADDLLWVQRRLFVVGSILAGGPGEVTMDDVRFLEGIIDKLSIQLPPLHDFILPGGTREASLLHVARSVCRRAERRVTSVSQGIDLGDENILPFLNRLSDYLFCAARFVNHKVGVLDQPASPVK
jgi:cob(I)alamin adenosyltransferase